jgi:mono/diheme cytochrome c family protein
MPRIIQRRTHSSMLSSDRQRQRSSHALLHAAAGLLALLASASGFADETSFHHAPTSVTKVENPYSGQAAAADAGQQLYAAHCAACHGRAG